MIFNFAAEDIDPNIVKIYLNEPEDDPNNSQPEIRASYKVPALLKVNRQARYVAKRIYPLVFSHTLCDKQIFSMSEKIFSTLKVIQIGIGVGKIPYGSLEGRLPVERRIAPTQTQTQRQGQSQTQKYTQHLSRTRPDS
jgi:hypothetical protein